MRVSLAFLLLALSLAATPDQWRGRTIYQIVTDRFARSDGSTTPCPNLSDYCGGTFQGIQNNLPYITAMGFDAIWISPIVANLPNGYHGYWAQNIYEINSNFGTEQDFLNLVQACHAAGMYVMLDVVANHMGTAPFNQLYPFNRTEYYHPYCNINDWTNQTQVIYCWLADLPDLDQANSFVRETLLEWIQDLIIRYDIDGLRIDTIPEVAPDFWWEFTQAAGVYTMGEVDNGNINYVVNYQGVVDGTLQYPLFYVLRNLFLDSSNSLYGFREFNQSMQVFPDQGLLCPFVDNQDNSRFLNGNNNIMAFQNAIAWTMTTLGIPILYYGDEQGFSGGNDPNNRETLWGYMNQTSEMYLFVQKVVQFRKQMQVWLYDWVERYADNNFYCFSRGFAMMCFSNTPNNLYYEVTYHPYSNGEVVCDVLWPGDCVTITGGSMQVVLLGGQCKLYQPKSTLIDS